MKFNFEKNLDHQSQAVKSTVGVFDSVEIKKAQGTEKQFSNPIFYTQVNFKYVHNIGGLQEQNSIERSVKGNSLPSDFITWLFIELFAKSKSGKFCTSN